LFFLKAMVQQTEHSHAVEAHRLVKSYGELTAVKAINFTVQSGETFGFLGPNGAGKSTTLRMIYCRTPLTSGTLKVQGLDVSRSARQVKQLVGVVPQENNLDPDLDVTENLTVYARYFRIPRVLAEERARSLLDFFGLREKESVNVEALSGGMKRRLIIARALINNPAVLVLDEPTTGLDPHVRHVIWDRLRELRRQGITIVLSSHYMEEAEKLCDRLIIMDHGDILTSGRPLDLIERYVQKFALEVHDVNGRPPVAVVPPVTTEVHGVSHYYFAPNPEILSRIMRLYEGHDALLRPSNLEDVFLRLTGRERME
jgi:lipooligosaccharide transport system ATP-binding protein